MISAFSIQCSFARAPVAAAPAATPIEDLLGFDSGPSHPVTTTTSSAPASSSGGSLLDLDDLLGGGPVAPAQSLSAPSYGAPAGGLLGDFMSPMPSAQQSKPSVALFNIIPDVVVVSQERCARCCPRKGHASVVCVRSPEWPDVPGPHDREQVSSTTLRVCHPIQQEHV